MSEAVTWSPFFVQGRNWYRGLYNVNTSCKSTPRKIRSMSVYSVVHFVVEKLGKNDMPGQQLHNELPFCFEVSMHQSILKKPASLDTRRPRDSIASHRPFHAFVPALTREKHSILPLSADWRASPQTVPVLRPEPPSSCVRRKPSPAWYMRRFANNGGGIQRSVYELQWWCQAWCQGEWREDRHTEALRQCESLLLPEVRPYRGRRLRE